VLSVVALPPHLVIGLTTLLPLGLSAQYLLSGARRQRLPLSFSSSFEWFASSYVRLREPWSLLWISPFSSWQSFPFEASSPRMALVVISWNTDTLIDDTTHDCCRFVLTQWLSASWLSSVGADSLTAACELEIFRVFFGGGTGRERGACTSSCGKMSL
jgi:hypothetical protein